MRRALMRSPALPDEVAERIVETRRSGMHTLGSNPAAPAELLADNPGARRRRERIARAAPGGLEEIAEHPNRSRYVELGSPTVDLVLAHAEGLRADTAEALATRDDPWADPWVLAILVARFGERLSAVVADVVPAQRRRVTRGLVERARRLVG